MGQCKSEGQDFKSYGNAVFRCGCCCLSANLSAKTLREIKGNMGQCKSKARTLREIMLKKAKRKHETV
jgi:hypothetical protein